MPGAGQPDGRQTVSYRDLEIWQAARDLSVAGEKSDRSVQEEAAQYLAENTRN